MKSPVFLGTLAGIMFWAGLLIGGQHTGCHVTSVRVDECKTPITFETVWFDERSVSVVSDDGQYLSCGFGFGQFLPFEKHELVGSMGYSITTSAPIIIRGNLTLK